MTDELSENRERFHDDDCGSELSLREELQALITNWGLDLPSDFDERTSLLASGLFDSLALFNLTLWIEKKTGADIDPTSVDIPKEWDSITSIVQYIREGTSVPDTVSIRRTRPVAPNISRSGYKVVKYQPRFKRAVAEFQTRLWSPNVELNLRYLQWKYESNPYAKEPTIYLAFHDDLLVGMRGFYPSRWETGAPSRQLPVFVADDLLVHEDHRNRGLVTRIMQVSYAELRGLGLQYLFNLSGSRVTVLGSLAMGWRSIGVLKPMGCMSSGKRFYPALRRRLSRLPFLWRYADDPIFYHSIEKEPYRQLDRAPTPFTVADEPAVEVDPRPRPKAMAALINRISHDGRLRHVRDESYLDWRFRNPFHEYRFLYSGGEVLDGYLVLKRSINATQPAPRVSIVDLEAINGDVRAALLKATVNAGVFSELTIWTATADSELVQQLHALGFVPIDQEVTASGVPCFLVRSIADDHRCEDWRLRDMQLLELKNWDIRMIYSMAG
jgi:acyl carrier protein/GNAT superfamily N-acetyltransferase